MTEERMTWITDALLAKYSWKAIAETLGVDNPDALRLQYGRATGKYKETRTRRATSPVDEVEVKNGDISITLHGNGSQESSRVLELTEEELTNPRSILLAHKYDPSAWELKWAKNAIWDGIPKKGEEIRKLYSSRITVQPKTGVDLQDIKSQLESAKPVAFPRETIATTGKRVLELSLADIHLGRLSWAGTAGENYDMEIGIQRVRTVINKVLDRMGSETFDTIIVPVGGDLLNCDSNKGETTGGTPQDNDGRFPRLFSKTMNLMAEIIEEMRNHCRVVRVVNTVGNHDENAATMLTYSLSAWFRNCPDIIVDTLALKRKYIEFGDCLLCIGHFAEEGKQLPLIIPHEASEAWGRTKYREAHGGHLHKESVIDHGGFVLRRSPSIVSPDEWTHGKGYGTRARHITYIWHPNRGMEETWIHGV